MVEQAWGKIPHRAETAADWTSRTGVILENIAPEERIIWLNPGETILGHTSEFIGGRQTVTTMMKARSSLGLFSPLSLLLLHIQWNYIFLCFFLVLNI